LRLAPPGGIEPIDFRIALEEIDHFELRPSGVWHKFFFEAVQLPRSTGKAFTKPPVATLKIKGQEVSVDIPEFAPLNAQLAIYQGDWANGAGGSNTWTWVEQRLGGAVAIGEAFTVVYHMRGLGRVPWQFEFQDSTTGKPLTKSEMSPYGSSRCFGSSSQAGFKLFKKPLEQIESVEITLQPDP